MSRPISTESVFRAIAHPTRRRMLQLLVRGEMAAGELTNQFHHTRPVASMHLRVLHGSGLVRCRRQGRQMVYELNLREVSAIEQWLTSLRRKQVVASKG